MPLPNPDYLTDEYFYWDGRQFPAVLISESGGSPLGSGNKRIIRWDFLDSYDRERVHDLIMGYINRAPAGSPTLTEANAVTNFPASSAYHTANYKPSLTAGSPSDSTGLVAGVNYTFSIILNGVTTSYTVNGTNAATFADLVTAIETAVNTGSPDVINASILGGNIEIATVATGSGQDIKIVDGTLFRSTTGFNVMLEKRVGVSTIGDVFDLNYRNEYQTYASLLIGMLRRIPNKTPRPPFTINDVYFNHNTETWLLTYDDSSPP